MASTCVVGPLSLPDKLSLTQHIICVVTFVLILLYCSLIQHKITFNILSLIILYCKKQKGHYLQKTSHNNNDTNEIAINIMYMQKGRALIIPNLLYKILLNQSINQSINQSAN